MDIISDLSKLNLSEKELQALANKAKTAAKKNVAPDIFASTFAVDEHTFNNKLVGRVTAFDLNSQDKLTYTIVGGNNQGAFKIDSLGNISIADSSKLNFESKGTYSLSVRVSDGQKTDTAKITINLNNLNDAPDAKDDTAQVLQDRSVVIKVLANDKDEDKDSLSVSSIGKPAHGTVVLNADGTVTYKPNAGFSGTDSFTYTVTDGKATDTATVNVTVKAPANTAPNADDSTMTVAENSAVGTIVGKVNATDAEGNTLTYKITKGNESGIFSIDSNGDIRVANNTKLDYELKDAHTLTVQVSDGKLTDTATVKINVSNVNEAPVLNDVTFKVVENSAADTVVGKLVAKDPDGNALTYKIVSGNEAAMFKIDNAGQITVSQGATLDYETKAAYELVVETSDGTLTDTATVKINVSNVNEAPVLNDTTLIVADKSAAGTVVGKLAATDADGDKLTYKIVSGNESKLFKIDNNGQITVAQGANLNYASKAVHTLVVETSDGKLTDNATVKINVSKINDAPVLNDTTLSVAENSATGTVVGKLAATDANGDALTYKIVSGNESGLFKIDNSGQITVAQGANLDYEAKAAHTLVVETSDGHLADTATIKINIGNVNEAPELNDATLNVLENSAGGTVVGKVTATDPDGDTLTYKIVSGNESGFFAVNNNGQITVAQGAHLDYETKNAYTLSVEASDGKLKDTANVKINIGDVNEGPVTNPNPDPTPTGTVYEIGKAGSPYQNLSDINWNSLHGGDVVKIYWKPEAYAERVLLSAHGEDGNPIIIEGVKGPNGELPVITAENATTDAQFSNFGEWRQNLGGSFYIGTPNGVGNDNAQPGFITIRGLELTGAGQGKTFTDALGRVSEEQGQPAIYVKGATNVTIEDNYMHHNGMGVFSNSNHDFEVVHNLVLRGNTFEDNGVPGSVLSHHVYTEGVDTLIDGNTFLEKIEGDLGSLLKMRDVGVTITNNYFGNTYTHAIDMGDVQADALNHLGLANSDKFHNDNLIAGNKFVSEGGGIFLGGDSLGKDTGSGNDSGLYRESVSVVSNIFEYSISLENYWRFGVFRAPSDDQTFNLENNVIDIKINETSPYYKPIIALMPDSGTINLNGENWISAETEQGTDRATGTINGWNSATTHHVTGDINIIPPGFGDVQDPDVPTTPEPTVNHAPVLNDATLSVAENSVAGTIVGKVTATDADGNPLTYKIVSGNESGFFSIDNNGQIKVTQGANLDYETKTSHTLVVESSDGQLADTANIKINVRDVNENTNPGPGTDPGTNPNPNPTTGTVYEIGKEGSPYQNLSDINWNSLHGGDVVKIYWKPEAYAERVLLSASGEDGNPIIIEGVKGPNGELPVITAENATTDDQFANFSIWRQDLGGSFYIGTPTSVGNGDAQPGFITIRGLELTGAGQGKTFTDALGRVSVEQGQPAIYVKGATNITIEDNYMHHNGMGVFSNSNHDFEVVQNLVLRGNTFEDNGVPGSFLSHHVYTEGIDTLIDGNTFLEKIEGDYGSLLKMRDVGVTITNNYFGNTYTHAIDMGDVQGDALNNLGLANSDKFHNDNLIAGNKFVSEGGGIFLGGDSLGKDTGSGEGSGLYRESVSVVSNIFEYSIALENYWNFGLFRAPSGDQTFNLENNVIDIKINDTNPYYDPTVGLMADSGTVNLIGTNWISSDTQEGSGRSTGTVNGWNNSTTHHVTGDIDITPPGFGGVQEPDVPTPNPTVNHAPVLNDATLSVAENSVAGTIVGKVTATDADGNPLTYKIVSGNESGFFSIDNNGQIKVAQGANLDYETKTSHTLVVETSDGKLTDTGNIKININDVNETTNPGPGTGPGTNPNPNPTVGTVYEIGKAGSQYQNLGDINWNSLKGGDVVKIYWKPEAYAERIILNAKGEDGNPIIIEGVKGPNGELPVLTAANATTHDQFDSFSGGRQNLGGIFSLGAPSMGAPGNAYPEHIVIRGLELTGSGQGNSFTNSHGQVSNEQGQSAIYIKGGKDIVIEDNYIHNNGMGVFSNSNHDNEIVENLVLRGNTFENNGEVGSYLSHHVYTEGINTLVEGNTFLKLIDGSEGGQLKMRDVGVTILNNYFGEVKTGAIDIGDVQADGLANLGLANSDAFHHDNLVAGNHFVSTGGGIYFGGDSQGKDMGAGQGSGLYRESVDIVSNVFEYSIELKDYWRFGLFRAPSSDQTFNLENNIIDIKINDTNPYYKPLVALMADSGTINLIGSNWINSETEQGTDRATGTVNGWNSADTHHMIDGHLLVGTDNNDVLTGTSGNDVLFGGLGDDILTGGAGSDIFFLMSQTGHDRITDFNKNEDRIDISTILPADHPLDSLLSEFVMLTKNGSDTIVSIDTDGGGDNFTAVATLVGVNNLSAGTHATEAELTTLVANGTLIA